jgi:hypothetical protein
MTKEELIEAAYEMTGGSIKEISSEQLKRLMTVTQYVTDICLNEMEDRGKLKKHKGMYCVPYDSDYMVETFLTRRYN